MLFWDGVGPVVSYVHWVRLMGRHVDRAGDDQGGHVSVVFMKSTVCSMPK